MEEARKEGLAQVFRPGKAEGKQGGLERQGKARVNTSASLCFWLFAMYRCVLGYLSAHRRSSRREMKTKLKKGFRGDYGHTLYGVRRTCKTLCWKSCFCGEDGRDKSLQGEHLKNWGFFKRWRTKDWHIQDATAERQAAAAVECPGADGREALLKSSSAVTDAPG